MKINIVMPNGIADHEVFVSQKKFRLMLKKLERGRGIIRSGSANEPADVFINVQNVIEIKILEGEFE